MSLDLPSGFELVICTLDPDAFLTHGPPAKDMTYMASLHRNKCSLCGSRASRPPYFRGFGTSAQQVVEYVLRQLAEYRTLPGVDLPHDVFSTDGPVREAEKQ